MIYFIGGPPRVGKSLIAKAIIAHHDISVVSTDTLGAVLETVLDPEAEPGLFAVTRFNELAEADRMRMMVGNATLRIACQIEESTAVWRGVKPFVLKEQDQDRDLVVEGVAVLPDLLAQLEGVDYRVVFVGNQGQKHQENIKRSAKENAHDWMRHASDEYMGAFASFVVAMSAYFEKEARRYGFKYIEMGGRPFNDALVEVVASLLGSCLDRPNSRTCAPLGPTHA
jgi:2-phosphoglycerate kinase